MKKIYAMSLFAALAVSQHSMAETMATSIEACEAGTVGGMCTSIQLCNTDTDNMERGYGYKGTHVGQTQVINRQAFIDSYGKLIQAGVYVLENNLNYGECVVYSVPVPAEEYAPVAWEVKAKWVYGNNPGRKQDWCESEAKIYNTSEETAQFKNYFKENKKKCKLKPI